jgi:hypothetical protein
MTRHENEMDPDLILAYEELDPEERERVDHYLEEHQEARNRLSRLQEAEARARAIDAPAAETDLSVAERTLAEASLNALLARTARAAAVEAHQAPKRSGWMPALWLPLAAAAVLLLLLQIPGRNPENIALHELSVVKVQAAGSTRGPQGDATLRTGDAFALRFELEAAATVLVFHVDPKGVYELVVPPMLYEAGEVRIPAEAEEAWILSGSTGTESFLVGLTADAGIDATTLEETLRVATAGLAERTDIVERIAAVLRSELDRVELQEFEHRP